MEHTVQENSFARVLAANAMSSSLQFLSQRSYLDELSRNPHVLNNMSARSEYPYGDIQWIKVTQVGKQVSTSVHQYFSTMQKILFSCHDPHRKQLIYLIYGNGVSVDLYLGIRILDADTDSEFAGQLSSFIRSSWHGANASSIELQEQQPTDFLKDDKLKKIYTFTGIPSFGKKDGEEVLNSIDAILGTLSNQKFAYLVIADPIDEHSVSSIINQCNEMAGQLESVKSFNFTDSINQNTTQTKSITRGLNLAYSESNSTSEKSKDSKVLMAAGMALAAGLGFDPSAIVLSGNMIAGFAHQETHSETESASFSLSRGFSEGYSEGQSQSLATNIVNRHVEYVLRHLNAHLDRLEDGLGMGMWNTGVYLLTSNDDFAKNASLQFKSVVSGRNSHLEPIRIHEVTNLYRKDNGKNNFKNAIVRYCRPIIPVSIIDDERQPRIIDNPFEGGESQLSTLLTTEELSCLINFPQRSVPGISVIDSAPDFSLRPSSSSDLDSFEIGNLLYSNSETNISVKVTTQSLTRHSLITGVNGSGKSNTVLNLLQESTKSHTPFMVIEPAKTEYVDWAVAFNKQLEKDKQKGVRLDEKPILIFIPGRSTYKWHNERGEVVSYTLDSLKINPFEVIGSESADVLAHLDRIKATFATAFPMYEILPVVLETLLFHVYKDCLTAADASNITYPQMLHLRACLEGVINSLGYDQRNRDNIYAAMSIRINSLLNGWKKELFDNPRLMGLSWDDLFNGRCVINLSAMGDDSDRAFVMSLLLQFLYEYRINESSKEDFSFNSNILRHLIIIEEAHRVMSYNPNPDSPQSKCGQLFSNMLSEIRAYGQGMVIVDQVPGRLIPDAIKNTNLKIIHRLIASDDVDAVSSSMGLSPEQKTIIPRLATGQAIVCGSNSGQASYSSDSDVYWCKILRKK